MVLIHGLATTRAIWTLVAPALARARQVVLPDLPGFGGSTPAGPGFQLELVADRMARGLSARGLRQFDLVGHSLGAAVALTLAARHPRSVRRLVLVAPAGLIAYPRAAIRVLAAGADGVLAVRRSLAPLTDLALGRRLLLALAVADAAALPATQARLLVEASAGAQRTAAALATVTRAELMPLLAGTPVPLGLIWGQRDRTVPTRTAERIVAARPDCQVELIPAAGHVSMVERPEAFVAALEGLLQRLGQTDTSSAGAARMLG